MTKHPKTDMIINLYVDKELPMAEVIQRLGVAGKTIRKVLAAEGHEPRSKNASRERNVPKEKLLDLRGRGFSIVEMGKELGVAHGTVHNYLKRYGINDMTPAEAKAARGHHFLWTEDALGKLRSLLEEGMSYSEAASEMGCTEEAVSNVNRFKLNVPMSIWQDAEFCNKVHADLEKTRSYTDTAAKFDIREDTLYRKNNRDWHVDLTINSTLFGTPTEFNETLYRSKKEALIARYLTECGVAFEYEKRVCSEHTWTCDFYIAKNDLWIEYDGLEANRDHTRAKAYNRDHPKIAYYAENGYKYVVLGKSSWKKQLEALSTSLGWSNMET